jgi:hypothetical protein
MTCNESSRALWNGLGGVILLLNAALVSELRSLHL